MSPASVTEVAGTSTATAGGLTTKFAKFVLAEP